MHLSDREELLSSLGFYKVSSPTTGVRRILRIVFQLQKPQEVLPEEETEMRRSEVRPHSPIEPHGSISYGGLFLR